MTDLVALAKHPLLFLQKAAGRVRRRLTKLPASPVTKPINGIIRFEYKFEPFLDKDDFLAMLTNSYDIILCSFLRKHLRSGDIFLDVGANVGYISAVAASYVGETGEVHSFEPLKECFARLETLAMLNPNMAFKFNNTALGDKPSQLPISYNPNGDSRNATLVPGKNCTARYFVPVERLDEYIQKNIAQTDRIRVIKIDVEGFELPVLKGLERFFVNTASRPLIVCEVKPWELQPLGYTLGEFDGFMKKHGYTARKMLEPGNSLAV